jgi:ABC-2 type transport system ATP-binding protein
LHIDHFILDLAHPIETLPIIHGYSLKQISSTVIEVGVPKDNNLNELFAQLSAASIQVISMKNKSNRLEQLFVDLIENKTQKEIA